jgi:membrane associated rhomboid family serine protease
MQHLQTKLPVTTFLTVAVCVCVHAVIFLCSLNELSFAFSPRLVLFNFEIYRMVTSVFVHGGLLHIFFNMSSTLYIQAALEQQHGSLCCAFLIASLIILIGVLQLILATTLWCVGSTGSMSENAVGFSGVLFSLLHLHSAQASSRSIYGFVEVPGWVYPWALLVLISVVMPNISWQGHLCGLVAGILVERGGMKWMFLSKATFLELDDAIAPRQASILPPNLEYVRTKETWAGFNNTDDGTWRVVVGGFRLALKIVKMVVETGREMLVGSGGGSDGRGNSGSSGGSRFRRRDTTQAAAERRMNNGEEAERLMGGGGDGAV